jgi:hypothetical protein
MLRCDTLTKGYRLYCPIDKMVVISQNVEFNKNVGPTFASDDHIKSLDTQFLDSLSDLATPVTLPPALV